MIAGLDSGAGLALVDGQRNDGAIARTQAALRGAKSEDQLRRTAEEFEGLVIGQMLAPMINTVPTDGVMGGGHAETVYRSMMVDEIGKAVARSGGLGIADMVYAQLRQFQEV